MATGKSSDSDLGQRGPCAPLTFLPPHRDVHSFTNGPPAGAKEVVDYSEGQVLREKTPADTDASSGPPPPGPANENEDKSIPVHCWSSPEGSTFSVRDKNYLVDRRKVQHRNNFLCTLEAVQLFKTNGPAVDDIASYDDSFVARRRKNGDKRFYIVVNYQCGGNPSPHLVLYFAMRDNAFTKENLGENCEAAKRCWTRFLNGSDEYKTARWKVIPSVPEGNWAVRNTIGQKPALLANKLTHKWRLSKEKQYLEVDCDVASSRVATYLMGVVHNNARYIVVNLGFLVESQREDELPETIIGAVSLHRMYLSNTPLVDPKNDFKIISRYSGEQLAGGTESSENGWFGGMMGAGMRAFGY